MYTFNTKKIWIYHKRCNLQNKKEHRWMRKKEDHKTKLNVLCHKTLSIKTNNSTKIHKFTVLAELKIIEQKRWHVF